MLTCVILDSKFQVIKQFLVRFTTLWPFTPKYVRFSHFGCLGRNTLYYTLAIQELNSRHTHILTHILSSTCFTSTYVDFDLVCLGMLSKLSQFLMKLQALDEPIRHTIIHLHCSTQSSHTSALS